MTNRTFVNLLTDIQSECLFNKWPMFNYKSYMNNLINITNKYGYEYTYNCFYKTKLPFVVFRSHNNFFYIDKYSRHIDVLKLDKNLNILHTYEVGYKCNLGFLLENIVKKV